jgi:hypothetical protein
MVVGATEVILDLRFAALGIVFRLAVSMSAVDDM